MTKQPKKEAKSLSKNDKKILYVGLITLLVFLLFWQSGGFLSSVAIILFLYSGYYFFQAVRHKDRRKRSLLIALPLLLVSLLVMPQDTTQQNSQSNMAPSKSSSRVSKPKVSKEAKKKVEPVALYQVTGVVDGDTIKVKVDGKEQTVRLIGIDTPETKDAKAPKCYGKEATARTQQLVAGKQVSLKKDKTQTDKDKYGRLLRYVYLEDKTNVNKVLVSEGYAKEYTYKKPYKNQKKFKKAQKQAKKSKKGLWATSTCKGDTKQTDPKVVKAQQEAKRKAEQEVAARAAQQRAAQQAAAAAEAERQRQAAAAAQAQQQQQTSTYYRNCTAARAAGAAPVYAGQPGYGTHLDRDRDGIGCE